MGHSTAAVRPASAADIDDGLRVTVLLADVVHLRNGLAILGGGWERVELPAVPLDQTWPGSAPTVDFGRLPRDAALDLLAEVRDPTQRVVTREHLIVNASHARAVVRPNLSMLLRFTVSAFGVWTIAMVSATIELAAIGVDVRPCS